MTGPSAGPAGFGLHLTVRVAGDATVYVRPPVPQDPAQAYGVVLGDLTHALVLVPDDLAAAENLAIAFSTIAAKLRPAAPHLEAVSDA